MFFQTTEGRIEKLEKKIKKLESSVKMLQDSFDTITEITRKMQEANSSLKENYQILGKTREKLKEIDKDEKFYIPIREKIRENVDFIKDIANEGVKDNDNSEFPELKSVKMLTEEDMLIFLRNGTMSSDELAHKLHVHKAQIEAWASKLQKKNIVETKTGGKKLLIKLKRE